MPGAGVRPGPAASTSQRTDPSRHGDWPQPEAYAIGTIAIKITLLYNENKLLLLITIPGNMYNMRKYETTLMRELYVLLLCFKIYFFLIMARFWKDLRAHV